MRPPLLGRYEMTGELAESQPVPAHDRVLDRDVDVLLLPCHGQPARHVLAQMRAAARRPGAQDPHLLDLAVVDGQPVAVLLPAAPPALASLLTGQPLAGPVVTPRPEAAGNRPRPRQAIAVAAAAAVAVVAVAAALVLSAQGPQGGNTAAPARPIVAPPAQPPMQAGVPAQPPGAPPAATPEEDLVLLVARVRDDPAAGPGAARLLRLLRRLDAERGPARQELAARTLTYVQEQSRRGRLRPDIVARTTGLAQRLASD